MFREWVPIRGDRESPRRRYKLPGLVVFLLGPFLRYSDSRDAWILRVVGEQHGPVFRVTPGQDVASRLRAIAEFCKLRLRWAAPLRPPAGLLVAGAIAIAAVLGFFIARSATGGSSTPSLGRPTSAGAIEASFPDGWRLRPLQKLPTLGLATGIGAVSGQRSIVVGTATTTDPTLLPARILDSLQGAPAARLLTVRGTTFYRYSDLSLRGSKGSLSVYAAPAPGETVLAVCRSPGPAASFASICQRVVQSLRLRSGGLSPGLVPAYATELRMVIDRLNVARTVWGSLLTAAPTASVQASAATRLAAAHDQAAAALTGQKPGPARSGNVALVAALRTEADAYSALASAAVAGQVSNYRKAMAAVADTNDAVGAALAALGSFGYRVS